MNFITKEVKFGQDARLKMINGINTISNAVKSTLGPKGRTVIFQKGLGYPRITKDGVTVAREISLTDPFENMGAMLLKSIAIKVADEAGDGTTTATILAQALINNALEENIKNKTPLLHITKSYKDSLVIAIKALKAITKDITDKKHRIIHIANISSNGDQEVSILLEKAFEYTGKDGVINIEETRGLDTFMTAIEGMQIPSGFIAPIFITHPEKAKAEFENPYILLYDRKIFSASQITSLMEKIHKQGESLIVIADDFEPNPINKMAINKLNNVFSSCAIKAPGWTENRFEWLQDIATFTGGHVISMKTGLSLETVDLSKLGRCKKVIVGEKSTTFIGGNSKEDDLNNRIAEIESYISETENPRELQGLQLRKANLQTKVVTISVGGINEIEMKERKDRIEDAMYAVKAALEEGIVAGGGISYLNIIKNHKEKLYPLFAKSLIAPFEQLLKSTEMDTTTLNAHLKIMIMDKKIKDNMGYDFSEDKLKLSNMLKKGIVDPTKVVISALEAATKIACLVLGSDTMISEIIDKEYFLQMQQMQSMNG